MNEAKVREVAELIEQIDAAAERGDDTARLVLEFQRATGQTWEAGQIVGFWRACSAEEMAEQALARPPLERDSVALIAGLLALEFPSAEVPGVLQELSRRTGDGWFDDLIFFPLRGGLTPEEILHIAEQRGRGVVLAPEPFLEWMEVHLGELPTELGFSVRKRLKARADAPEPHEAALAWLEAALAPAKAGYVRQAYEKWKHSY